MKLLKMQYTVKRISAAKIRSAANSVEHQRKGQKPYLSADEEEALVIATAKIKESHSQPVQRKRLAAQLNYELENMPDNPRTAIAGGAKKSPSLRTPEMSFAASIIRESLGWRVKPRKVLLERYGWLA
jgi:hypothetical protein